MHELLESMEADQQAGSALVLTLVFFAVFVVIAMAWMGLAVTQNSAIVGQEQEEQSFHLSEAGVHYVLHLLNQGVCTPIELDANEPVIQTVPDVTRADDIGTFNLTFRVTPMGSETVTEVTALGYDIEQPRLCQELIVTVKSVTGALGTRYVIQNWDHRSRVSCGSPGPAAQPSCSGA